MISLSAWLAGRSRIGLDQRVLVICVRFSNQTTTRLASVDLNTGEIDVLIE